MEYEVENKYPVADLTDTERRLSEMDAIVGTEVRQIDTYFAHPARDFSKTDEAIRIRRIGEENFLTYKGPKIDSTTKTRREIELPITPGEQGALDWTSMLEALGFQVAAEVRKRRRQLLVTWKGTPVGIALDEVEGLGTFVELEIAADARSLSEAQRHLTDLAQKLKLANPERGSYLELLLDRDGR
jgi:adenylate cyclase class 2